MVKKQKVFEHEDQYAVCPYCGVCNENTEWFEHQLSENGQTLVVDCPHCFHKHDVQLVYRYRTAK